MNSINPINPINSSNSINPINPINSINPIEPHLYIESEFIDMKEVMEKMIKDRIILF